MINEFFCWLIGHQAFSGAKGVKLYRRDGRRFVYIGMDLYSCKCCNRRFIKAEGAKAVLESVVNLLTATLPGIKDSDVSAMPLTEGKMRHNIKDKGVPSKPGLPEGILRRMG